MKHRTLSICSVLLAIVLGLAAVYLVGSLRRVDTKPDKARFEIETILSDALELHRTARGRYPSTHEGLGALVRAGVMRRVPDDPWHRPYEYRFPALRRKGGFDLWSYGADGKPGGDGVDADITNWGDDA